MQQGMRVVTRRAVNVADEDQFAGTGFQHEREFFSGHHRWATTTTLPGSPISLAIFAAKAFSCAWFL
jgi:hypothetical protein